VFLSCIALVPKEDAKLYLCDQNMKSYQFIFISNIS